MSTIPQPSSRISVVLVSYNTGSTLFKAIESILRQPGEVELIVVNNGNPEDTIVKLKDISAAYCQVRIITGHGNIGFSRANNLGVSASTGDYILILNPDCVLSDNTLQKLLSHTLTLQPPFIIGARILNEDGSDQRGCRRALLTPMTAFVEAMYLSRLFPRVRLNLDKEPIPHGLSSIPAISGAFMFLSRKDFDMIGGFDAGYFLHVEDLDLCFRFRQAGGEIYFAPDVVALHVGGTSEVTSNFIESCKRRGFIRYFHSNFGKNTPLAFLWCLDIAIWMRYLVRRFTRR